jgi:uroporphyrin-III C-methyltransferase/precorrin-2 dehydrogenase/sirohydrochlorin ferrochelatase
MLLINRTSVRLFSPLLLSAAQLLWLYPVACNAPVLTRLLRARIETLLPASLGNFAQRVGAFRQQVSLRLPDMQQRLRFWDQLLQRQLIGADGDLQTLMDESAFEQQAG